MPTKLLCPCRPRGPPLLNPCLVTRPKPRTRTSTSSNFQPLPAVIEPSETVDLPSDLEPCPVPCFSVPPEFPFQYDSFRNWAASFMEWAATYSVDCRSNNPEVTKQLLIVVGGMMAKIVRSSLPALIPPAPAHMGARPPSQLPNVLSATSLYVAAAARPHFWHLLEEHAVQGWKIAKRSGFNGASKARLAPLLQEAKDDYREGVAEGIFSDLDEALNDLDNSPDGKKPEPTSAKRSDAEQANPAQQDECLASQQGTSSKPARHATKSVPSPCSLPTPLTHTRR
ncbi:hypothetical protein AURDEDRAFT_159376 [Auricularia subglabra TFB-10046 SS5]|nr:hypothetical protein AURDEDRAFT_159376 [Auricularia subglabra TFB-10046 SS5]